MKSTMFVFSLIFSSGLVLIKPAGGSPLPSPQLIVKSQSNLFSNQPGRQIDLSDILPTEELFWLNLEEGYFACQLNESEKFLKIFRISRLCDYKEDCYKGSDELQKDLRCSTDCDPPCLNGVCLSSRPESQCHCDDGWGGKLCEEPDLNECKYRPCSLFAQCTNTLGSFYCTCKPGYVGDGFECRPEVERDQSDYDSINEVMDDEIAGDPGFRSSICTYNGVEYLEGEEVFTQRRCSDCRCRNGEIRCDKVVCEPPPEGNCKSVSRVDRCCPEYVCENKVTLPGLNGASLPRKVDLDESRFADVIQNVKDLIGGLDRSPVPTPSSDSPTPISILDFVVNGANKPVTDLTNASADKIGFEATTQTMFTNTKVKTTEQANTKTVNDVDKTIDVIKTVQNIIGDLEEETIYKNQTKDQINSDTKVPCEKDCVFKEDHAIVYTSTLSPTSSSKQEILISSETSAPATSIPGIVQLSISPSPAENSSDFEPFVPSEEIITEQTTQDITSITVTNDEGIKIQDDKVLIEINFPGDYNENREDDVSVKFTFEEENENEIDDTAFDFKDNENTFLYDVVTDLPTTTPFRPPNFDSLPIFEKDIFDPTIHNTFFEENIETDYSTAKGSDNPEEIPTETPQVEDDPPVQRENESSRPEIKTILPEDTLGAVTGITVTENILMDEENIPLKNSSTPIDNTGKLPKEMPLENSSKDTSYFDKATTPLKETMSTLTDIISTTESSDMLDDIHVEKTTRKSANKQTTLIVTEDVNIPTEKYSFPGPARPRYDLDGEEQGSGVGEMTTWTDPEITTQTLTDMEKTESTIAYNIGGFNSDTIQTTLKTTITETLDTTRPASTLSGKELQTISDLDNNKMPDTTQMSTIYAVDFDENTPSLIKLLDEGLPSTRADYEPTDFTDKYTITQEEVTEQYTEQITTVRSATKFIIPKETILTSTHSNSLKSETGSENGSTTVSSRRDGSPTSENTSRPERVTVHKIESSNTTFSTPTPSKLGNKTELKENNDESSYATISLYETTTERFASNSLEPTSIKNFKDIQTVLQNEIDSTPAPEKETDQQPENEDKSPIKNLTDEDITMDELDISEDIDKTDTNSYANTPKSSVGPSSSTKNLKNITTERSDFNTNGAQPRRDDSVFEECLALNLPKEFYSFSGQTPTNIADCSWDFFGCTKKFGKWPENKACCEDRFSQCSMLVMGMVRQSDVEAELPDPNPNLKEGVKEVNTRKNIGSSDKIAANEIPNTNNNKDLLSKESRLNDVETKIFLIHCIWKYMNCSTDDARTEQSCRDQFSTCSNNVDDEDEDNVQGLPDVPGADLPSLIESGNVYASCILVYYNCSDTKIACKKEFNDCAKNLPVKVSVKKNPVSQGSSSRNESGDRYTPNISSGSGKIPEIQCTWSFFQCKKNTETCTMEHDDCLNGNIFDNKICAGVAKHPERYLVPHPTDCTKFYSCQRQGWGGWIANPMDCPVTTGFDKSLMICNYINSLARCKEDILGSVRSDNLRQGLIAKQTQQQLEVQVGNLGYFSAQNLTSYSPKLPTVDPSIALCMFVSLRLLL